MERTKTAEPESQAIRSALSRKLNALQVLTVDAVAFLESLQTRTVEFDEGVEFVADGDPMKTSFIVQSGWAIRYVLLSSGRRQIISFALPGDILGLHADFKRTATYSASALTPLKVATVEPKRLIDLNRLFPTVAAGLSWCSAREHAILGDQAVRLGRLAADQRIIHLLLELWHRLRLIGENDGRRLDVPMTQTDIADTLGLSLVHTNRQLSKLRRDGRIAMEHGKIRLNDFDRLIDMSEFNPDHLKAFSL